MVYCSSAECLSSHILSHVQCSLLLTSKHLIYIILKMPLMNSNFLSGIPLSVTDALSCVWHVWYTQKRSATTTPTTPGRHPKPAYLHSHPPRSTHHGHPPPQRTYRPQASNRHPKQSSEQNAH